MPTANLTNVMKPTSFMSTVLGIVSGAEAFKHGTYSFVTDNEGRPELTGGVYNAEGQIERSLYEAEGQSYHGKPRSVFFTVKSNETGMEYRLAAKALQEAYKTAGIEPDFEATEMQQVVEKVDNYKRASVSFKPVLDKATEAA